MKVAVNPWPNAAVTLCSVYSNAAVTFSLSALRLQSAFAFLISADVIKWGVLLRVSEKSLSLWPDWPSYKILIFNVCLFFLFLLQSNLLRGQSA